MPVTGAESWTVLDDDLATVEPAERFLAHLAAIERSPNTLRAYAHSLALWFEWLGLRDRVWDAAEVEDVSEFVRWLRAPADNVIVLDVSASRRSESPVNRHLAAVFGFYDFHVRSGVALAEILVAWRRVPRGSYKPFLHHVTAGRPVPTRPVKLKAPRRLPGSLTIVEVTTILAACTRLRDRFLFALLAETGMRIGQALGLRHADFVSRRREVTIVPRDDNVNGARVSRSLLYRDPDLRAEIDRIRARDPLGATRRPAAERTSDASLQQRLTAALSDNQSLRDQNRRLTEQVAVGGFQVLARGMGSVQVVG
jgi:integrase